MAKNILSKSTFIKGEQCLKALYLYKHRNFLRDRMPPERLATFTRGIRVGLVAQQLFPGGVDCGIKSPRQYDKAIEKTAALIKAGQEVIYEAAFRSHQTLIFLDVLVKKDDGWHAYEVKSSTVLSDTYYKDAALQHYVIEESGLKLSSFNLVHINPDYLREDDIHYEELFIITELSEYTRGMHHSIDQKIRQQLSILSEAHSPKISIGLHCRRPYDCDFISHCHKEIKRPSPFDVPALSFEEQWQLYEQGHEPKAWLKALDGSPVAQMQSRCLLQQKDWVDKKALQRILPTGKVVLFKGLIFRPAIPLFKHTRPYQAMLYGYALQIIDPEHQVCYESRYISREKDKHSEDIARHLEKEPIEGLPTVVFDEEELQAEVMTVNTENYLGIQELYSKGLLFFHTMKSYRFADIHQATCQKRPWFTKVLIDRQAALVYEKAFLNNFSDDDALVQLENYLGESIKYLNKLFHCIKVKSL